MRYQTIERDDVVIGAEIDLWFLPDGNGGWGGKVLSFDDTTVTTAGGTSQIVRTARWDEVHHLTIEVALDADECLQFGPDCKGVVDYRTTGSSMRAWPRCEFHADKRQRSYETTSERYADSDCAPSGFDPADIGERFFEDA